MKICLLIIFVLLTSCNQKTQNSSSTTVEDKKEMYRNDIASYVIFEKEMNPSNGSKDEHIDLMDYSFINIKSKALDL